LRERGREVEKIPERVQKKYLRGIFYESPLKQRPSSDTPHILGTNCDIAKLFFVLKYFCKNSSEFEITN